MCFHQAQIRHLSMSNSHWGYNSVSACLLTTGPESHSHHRPQRDQLQSRRGNWNADSKHRTASQPRLSGAGPSEMRKTKKRKQRNKKGQRLISQIKACDSWAQRAENNCMESVLSFIYFSSGQWTHMVSFAQQELWNEPSSPANMISELVFHWSGTLWVG